MMLSFIPSPEASVRSGLTGLLLLAAPFLLGADDAYLSEIEEEAKRQATLLVISPEPVPPSSTDASPTEAANDQLPAGLNQAAFEKALRENLPGTYVLYQQLNPADRKQIYDAYQKDNRLASISQQVFQLLGAKS